MVKKNPKSEVLEALGDLIIDSRKSWASIQMELRHIYSRTSPEAGERAATTRYLR
jgi:hypothetical protein